jgi:glycosyltransferase involved in cell wall biosynthesis
MQLRKDVIPLNKPVRILHIFAAMNRGGAETFIMNLYRNINREKIQFDFAVTSDIKGHFDDEIRQLGGKIYSHPDPSVAGLRSYKKAFTNTIRNCGPFVGVHSHVHNFSGFTLAIAKKEKVTLRIAHSHTTHDGYSDSVKRNIYRWYTKRLIHKYSTHMFGCSRAACESLFGFDCWDKPNTKIIHNSINLNLYEKLSSSKRSIREKLSLPVDSPLIGHVGRFNEVKNHRFIIELFYDLHLKFPNANLILVGDGELRSDIERMIKKKGLSDRIHLLGVRDDIPEIMASLDLFLFPSFFEGLGIVLIEAQAAGIPCVCADTVPIEADIQAGLVNYVSLNDPKEKWINIIINSFKTKQLNWNYRKTHLENTGYNIKTTAKKLGQIYIGKSL